MVNRDFCKRQMMQKAPPAPPPNESALPYKTMIYFDGPVSGPGEFKKGRVCRWTGKVFPEKPVAFENLPALRHTVRRASRWGAPTVCKKTTGTAAAEAPASPLIADKPSRSVDDKEKLQKTEFLTKFRAFS